MNRRTERRVISRSNIRDDVERELASHVRMRADELIASGWTEEEAETEARRLLGDHGRLVRSCVEISERHQRAVRRANVVDAMAQDLKFGLRTVRRSPGFAVVATLTLALGIGAITAIFSVVDGVLLEPLPFHDPQELVDLRERHREGGAMSVAWANFTDWRNEAKHFDAMFAYASSPTTVLGGETPVTTTVAAVSSGIWNVFGVSPLHGRLTVEADHALGAPPVVVVSERFWRDRMGQRPIDGQRLDLNGVLATVVGVVPSGFDFPSEADVWLPAEAIGPQSTSRSAHNWRVLARLADGESLEGAVTVLDELTRRIVQSDPTAAVDDEFLAVGAVVRPLQDVIVGSARAPLLILLGAAGLVLLIACTNLASTLLARGANRTRELAVRSSLGAGRGRLVRQLMTESVVLAAGGAVAGVVLAGLLVDTLRRLGPASVPRLQDVGIDASVLLFTLGITVLTTMLFGLFPALRLLRGRPVDDLRAGARGNALGGRGLAWTLLVGGEVALALVLIVGSGLLVRSFRSVLSVEAGFDPSDVISTPVQLSRTKYEAGSDHAAFYDRALEQLEADPSIEAAGVVSSIPLARFFPNGRVELDGDLEKNAVAGYVTASRGAFEALDIPLLRGRLFDRSDTPDAPHVVIVSESFAETYWPGEDPIGRSVTGGGMDDFWQDRRFAQVVGVVGDVRYSDLASEPEPTLYFPYTQRPFRIQFGSTVVAEAASGDAASAGGALRATLERLDPDIPVNLSTQRQLIDRSVAQREFTMLLLASFSLLALTLAVVGIYGVVSYSVATRRREMGIRLALGADRGGVVGLVVRSAMAMVAAGLVVGTAVALFAGRLLEGMLYRVEPGDPLTVAGSVVVLLLAGFLASWIPATLGTRVDPIVTMRAE